MNKFKFAIQLPSSRVCNNGSFKRQLLNDVYEQFPWLSVNTEEYNDYGVQYAGANDLLTFGMSNSYDVDWRAANSFSAKEVDTITVIDCSEIEKMNKYVNHYAKINKPSMCLGYYTVPVKNELVRVYDNFIQVGTTVIPRYAKNQVTLPSYAANTIKEIYTVTYNY